jgi:sigma-B regulation protein RsbU (phosphoserine phosphatase)
MRVLIAEDEPVARRLLDSTVRELGYEVTVAQDGREAWDVLRQPHAPRLAILDWQMPGLDGLELCRRLRADDTTSSIYVVLLTGQGGLENRVAGLRGGADDYLTKPFDVDELSARLAVGGRIAELQERLAARVRELEETLAHVQRLRGLIPICAWCKKVRTDRDYWQQVEEYIIEHSEARFSHGICPDCLEQQRT